MFSDELLAATGHLLEMQKEHPFVRGIGDGSLDEERFRRWLRQDYRYLEHYARALACAAARAPDFGTMERWVRALHLTVFVEIDLHRKFSAGFGLSADHLEQAPLWPTTRDYVCFLERTAASDNYARMVASHLPCAWDYCEIARHLQSKGLPADSRYAGWIRQYSAVEFMDMAVWLKEELDRRTEDLAVRAREEIRDTFAEARQFEVRFWNMCWYGED